MKILMITVVMAIGLNSCEVPREFVSRLGLVSTSSLGLIGPNESTEEGAVNVGESPQSGCFFTNQFS